jgi:multidrug resistance protein MdtO
LSVEDQERCRAIAGKLSDVRSGLAGNGSPAWNDRSFTGYAYNPILMEIERTTNLMIQCSSNECLCIRPPLSAATPSAPAGGSITGALRNTEHIKFAVRGTLAAFLCYVFYMSAGWMGLGPSIVTCILTARPVTGASRHRQTQRFAGFILGAGIIGWGTEVFILPQIDTLAQYALLFASVVWIGSWVATSGPRIAFFGFQIVLAYSFVNLNRFTINTSLVPARDIVLGIVLGVVAMWLVFDHLWAQTSGPSVRGLFLGTLRGVANLKMATAEAPGGAALRLAAESSKINRDFDKLRDLASMYVFESFPKKSQESLVNRSIRTLLPELRAFLLVKTGLLQQRCLTTASVDEALIQKVEERSSEVLRELADAIEGASAQGLFSWNARTQELREKISREEDNMRLGKDEQSYTQLRLCASLLDLASDLERRARLNFTADVEAGNAIGSWPSGAVAKT